MLELIYVIVNYGMGSKVLHKSREYGIKGGTVFIGSGTVQNGLLNFLSLYDERKEIVILCTEKEIAEDALVLLNKHFQFHKPHHGIMFSVPTYNILGSTAVAYEDKKIERSKLEPMYHIIFTIVDKGKGVDVINASREVGANGGTIINARGSGSEEVLKVFNMEIEPEKEIVLILSKEMLTDSIVQSIRTNMAIDVPGNGVVFVQNVNQVYGLFGS